MTTHDVPVRVGIAGLGRSGWGIHARTLGPMSEQFRVVAVTDPIAARREEAAERFGCEMHTGFEALAHDPGVALLVVATPSYLHPRHTIQALHAGKDVVCEKPMATTLADADAMIAAAREAGRTLAIFQNRRYAPDFLKVREVIASGKLGRIVMIRMAAQGFGRRWDWQTLKEYAGGSLNNTGPHFLDQALELFGDAQPQVFCRLERTLASGDAEDHCKVILHAEGAPMIDLEITSACACPQDSWLVMGTSGGLAGNARSLRWRYVDLAGLPPRPVDPHPTPDRSYNREDLPWQEETWEKPDDLPGTETCFYRDLFETLVGGAPLAITPQSVRRQVAVLEECHRISPV